MMAATTTPGRRRWQGMPFIALGVSIIIVDATIVNVAVPSIIRDLHVSTSTTEWFNAIYALVFAALLITVGRARRPVRPPAVAHPRHGGVRGRQRRGGITGGRVLGGTVSKHGASDGGLA
jgi:MFS family permease